MRSSSLKSKRSGGCRLFELNFPNRMIECADRHVRPIQDCRDIGRWVLSFVEFVEFRDRLRGIVGAIDVGVDDRGCFRIV